MRVYLSLIMWFAFTPLVVKSAEVDFKQAVAPIFAKHCVSCHGPAKQFGGLRLDTPGGIKTGGDSGPTFVAKKSSESRLIQAVSGQEGVAAMPPKGPRLAKADIETLSKWIDSGANLPEESASNTVQSNHWAFQPIRKIEIPSGKNSHPIDAFIRSRLKKEGIAPSEEASRATLLRRIALDLTGIPPTPEEIDQFIKDREPNAYERQVDRLLASPHYGERWGRHWLDLARYADSNGYSIDAPRSIWPYRDWVIKAHNDDMPFDRFTIEQLAGDLLERATKEQKVATGFHRNTQINQEGGIDLEQFRVEAVVDRVNTTGSVWLGLTVGCCQCHNHKFDPLTQREYYQLFAFFNSQDDVDLVLGEWDSKLPPPPEKDPILDFQHMDKKDTKLQIKTMVMSERKVPRENRILIGGDFTRKGTPVSHGTFAVMPPMPKSPKPSRLDLAKWLVAPENPLTARVLVNRVWAQYFGLGIVETVNDFGTQGTPPSHPELLDWLANEFIRTGWSMKKLHKLIVTSATYRQSSHVRADLKEIDPRNRLLARQSRIRLEAEIVRDVALSASGLLSTKIGGPSVYPPQPAGLDKFTQVNRKWTPSEGPNRYRRGMYTYFWRSNPHPMLTTFDAPDAGTTCTRRNKSNTPLQALTLLNDEGYSEFAYGLAKRVLDVKSDQERVVRIFRLCIGREPTSNERERLSAYYQKQFSYFHKTQEEAKKLLSGGGPTGKKLIESKEPDAVKAALVLLSRVALNLDETITRE